MSPLSPMLHSITTALIMLLFHVLLPICIILALLAHKI